MSREASGLTWWTALGSFAIGGLLCVFNILVIFRTGVAFGGSALVVLLGATWLRARSELNWHRLFVIFSVASSGYLAAAAVDSGVAARHLHTGHVPPWPALVLLSLLAAAFGLVLGAPLGRLFGRTDPAYPTLRPAIALMEAVSRSGRTSSRPLLVSGAAGAAVTLAALPLGGDATVHLPGLPPYLGLAVSPMLLGVGVLAGARATAWLLVGSLYSVVLWGVRDGGRGYEVHLSDPWVLAVGIGIIVGHSVAVLLKLARTVGGGLPRTGPEAAEGLGGPLRRLGLLAALSTVLLVARYGVPHGLLLGALTSVMVVAFALFLAQVGAETGIAPLSPVIFLGIILLRIAGLSAGDATVLGAAVAGAGISALYYTYALRMARTDLAAPPRRGTRLVLGSQAVGGLIGVTLGLLLIAVLLRSGVVGTDAFPAPLARAFEFVADSADGGGAGARAAGPPLLLSLPVGFALTFAPVSPSSLGLGMLLPPATVLVMALGGAVARAVGRWAPERTELLTTVASGLVIGEGLVSTAAVAVRAFG
ncbi:hypothetical protein [Kitasatospora phosalacinea]|uniref:PhpB n=1 Tax=Kitasatospora phosalacinea TaxID=2065 RepID=A0A0M3WNW9_9ACTN|nr:hypothetical protein [Kitasatospora phosalacinea]AKO69600.1 PhpB [Kitasatospora phosalacinea]